MTPQLCPAPAVNDCQDCVDVIAAGADTDVLVPVPSWPDPLPPQQ